MNVLSSLCREMSRLSYIYTDNEGNPIGEQLDMFDILDGEDEDDHNSDEDEYE